MNPVRVKMRSMNSVMTDKNYVSRRGSHRLSPQFSDGGNLLLNAVQNVSEKSLKNDKKYYSNY